MKPVLHKNNAIRAHFNLQHDSSDFDWWLARAPAKLNLFLHIVGQRADGYHLLQTIFQFLDWHDELNFNLREDGQIVLQTDLSGVSADDNLVVRAARLLQLENTKIGSESASRGCNIVLHKKLPMGAGLGGGSSDAATTLVVLNELWQLHLPTERLQQIGLELGADVPVFVAGKACWAEGTGEIMTPLELPEPCYLVLCPGTHVETASVFRDSELTRNCSPIKIADFLSGRSRNVCQKVVLQRHPAVEKAMNVLRKVARGEQGVWQALEGPRMTGTGSSLFLACCDAERANVLQLKVDQSARSVGEPESGYRLTSHVAQGANISALYN